MLWSVQLQLEECRWLVVMMTCYLLANKGVTDAEVMGSLDRCSRFFFRGHIPQLPLYSNGKRLYGICQRFNNHYYYATVYNHEARIPVFSAYTLDGTGQRSEELWKVEPQIGISSGSADMERQPAITTKYFKDLFDLQAMDQDYKVANQQDRTFDRGHLNPSIFHGGESDHATFTLTNAVPQYSSFNSGGWRVLEKFTLDVSNTLFGVRKKAYLLTGSTVIGSVKKIPENPIEGWPKGRVTVPKYMWTALCGDALKSRGIISFGYVCYNQPTPNCEFCSIGKLEIFLKKERDIQNLFPEDCKSYTLDDFKKVLQTLGTPSISQLPIRW